MNKALTAVTVSLFSLILVTAAQVSTAQVSAAHAATTLQLINSDSQLLNILMADGITGGEQVDTVGQSLGNLTVDSPLSATYADPSADARATLVMDQGNDLYRFEGAQECAGLLDVRWQDRQGAATSVLDARIIAAVAAGDRGYLVQAVSTVDHATQAEYLAVRGGEALWVEVSFALGADSFGRAASYRRAFQTTVGCDQIVRLDVTAADGAATVGFSDVGPAPADVVLPVRGDARTLLDTTIAVSSPSSTQNGSTQNGSTIHSLSAEARVNGTGSEKMAGGGSTSLCTVDTFDGPDLDPVWQLSLIGDADQGTAVPVAGRLQLSGNGTSFYHAPDNGAFLQQSVDGDFRAAVTLIDVPVNQGGDFRKFGIDVRQAASDVSPRIFAQLVVDHPVYNTTALQFDFRNAAGETLELASTPVDLDLPLMVAIDRRGDLFTAYFSSDNGQTWLKPTGGRAQGAIEIPMGTSALVGLSATSYDANLPMTVEFDDFELCLRPLKTPPNPAPEASCRADRALDLIYLLDASGSMTAAFNGFPSKLEAAAAAIADTNAVLRADFPGARSALIAYRASVLSDPAFNLSQGAQVLEDITTDLDAVTAAAGAIDPSTIHVDANTPAPIALDRTTQLLLASDAPNLRRVVVWLTDGAPNIDSAGRGAREYRFSEILPLSIRDGDGDFLPWPQVAWLGNFNGAIGTYDGEVYANTMFEIERLKDTLPDTLIYPVAIQGADTYYEDLMAYSAFYTGTQLLVANDVSTLADALAAIIDDLDCGATIGDRVWLDTDGNGLQDDGATGLVGVTVELLDGSGTVIATEVTGTDGAYLFENLVPGTYVVRVDASTLPASAALASFDFDGVSSLHQATVTVARDEVQLEIDFGYQSSATIGDRVWLDTDGNGLQDDGATGFVGVTVELVDGSGTVIDTQVTGTDGAYLFSNVVPGTYSVRVDIASLPATAGDPTFDFDGVATANQASVSVGPGDVQLDVDFGYQPLADECVEGTYRDDFNAESFANQDGSLDWSADWVEDDPVTSGTHAGQIQVHDGLLTLDDAPNTNAEPSAAREADLEGATRAVVRFAFLTSQGVDPSDAVTFEVSDNGGATWTELEIIDGIQGSVSGTREFDITGFASENTQVRFRVSNLYGGSNELFCVDWIEIVRTCDDCTSRAMRDDFSKRRYSANDGPDAWSGSWQEVDALGAGPNDGAVRIDSTGFVTLNLEETANEPSIAREANLSASADGGSAALAFRFVTSSKVDADDAFYVEVSSDGGATFTTIDTVTGIAGYQEESRSYDISAFASERTVVRFRIAPGSYLGHGEAFCIDWVEVFSLCEGEQRLGSISGVVWNDLNGNGIQEDANTGLSGVKVKLIQDGNTLATQFTDGSGRYSFGDLEAGTYKVKVVASTLPTGLDEQTFDIDGVGTADRASFDLGAGQDRDDVDFGYRAGSSCYDCEHDSGWLNGTGDYDLQPDGSHFWSNSGTLEGWLEGDGQDFDLYLLRWNGSRWKVVDRSIAEDTSTESVSYNGYRGYYIWKVKSYRGSGSYELQHRHP